MRKIVLISVLSLLPFTQMASEVLYKIGSALQTHETAKPAPELPLNVLHYFIQ